MFQITDGIFVKPFNTRNIESRDYIELCHLNVILFKFTMQIPNLSCPKTDADDIDENLSDMNIKD